MHDIAIETGDDAAGGGRKIDVIVAALAIVIVGAAGAWFLLGSSDVPTLDDVAPPTLPEPSGAVAELNVTATEGESVDTLANKARMALSADMLAEPPGQNALYYYSLAVEADPENTEMRDELAAVAEQVSGLIRDLVAADNWGAAEQLTDRLALAVPTAPVLGEYETALGARRQTLLDEAVAEATAGRARSASALLEQARALPGGAAASIRQTQTQLAEIADQRRIAAEQAAARAAEARAAAAQPVTQPAAPTPQPTPAAAPAAPATPAPRATEPSADVALANSIRARITSGELDGDSGAIAALTDAVATYPDSEAVRDSADLLFAAVDSLVQRQLAGDDTRAAAKTLRAVEGLPGAETALPPLQSALAETERRLAGATVIPASQLELVEAVPPVYPISARRRELEGWVDIEFTVTSDGSTSDIVFVRTSDSSIFNRATAQAVSQWRFKPRMFRGEPIDQRVTTRIGFRME